MDPHEAITARGIEWELDLPLLTNRFILYDFAKVFAWTAVVMISLLTVLFAATGELNMEQFAGIAGMTALGIFVVALLAVFVMAVFFGNRYRVAFSLGPKGIGYESRSRRGKWASRAAVVAGALGGRPGTAGAGLLAMSRERVGIRWNEIRRVNEHAEARVFSLRNSWRVVLRLHCTPENYEQVRQYLAAHLPPGAIVPGTAGAGGEAARGVLLAAAAYAAASFGAGGVALPWLAGAAALMGVAGFLRGGARRAVSGLAVGAAAIQLADWPGGAATLLEAGWLAIPVAAAFAAIVAGWIDARRAALTLALVLPLAQAHSPYSVERPRLRPQKDVTPALPALLYEARTWPARGQGFPKSGRTDDRVSGGRREFDMRVPVLRRRGR